jgi:hypothetical protein
MRRVLTIGLLAIAPFMWCTARVSADDFDLAMSYRPILKFDSAERWRPLEIETFFAESLFKAPHRVCVPGTPCTIAMTPAALPPDRKDAVLDIAGNSRDGKDYRTVDSGNCEMPRPLLDCDSGRRSAIYYKVQHARDLVTIDYWWFLRYNDFPYANALKCRIKKVCDDHEGDWEGVRVLFRSSRPHNITVRFDAHGRSEQYEAIEPERIGDRPIVYVALGTHASYPKACRPSRRRYCRQTGADLPDGRFNGKAEWGRNQDAECAATCLLPLQLGGWASWPGTWGRSCNDSGCIRQAGPRSPGLQDRFPPRPVSKKKIETISLGTALRLVLKHR